MTKYLEGRVQIVRDHTIRIPLSQVIKGVGLSEETVEFLVKNLGEPMDEDHWEQAEVLNDWLIGECNEWAGMPGMGIQFVSCCDEVGPMEIVEREEP